MSKIEKSLAKWVSQGLLEKQQADAILKYEAARSESSWILYGLMVLGAIIIGIGVISLIAANWHNISNSTKLITDFAILTGLAIFILQAFIQNKGLLFEILILIFMLFCLASIGLISQIYNTGGEFYEALMLWSVITFPITIFSKGKLVHMVIPFIWLGGFLTGLSNTMLDSAFLVQYFHTDVYAVAMIVPLLCTSLMFLGIRFSFEAGYIRALQTWFYVSGLIAIGIVELGGNLENPNYFMGYILALVTTLGIINNRDYNHAQKLVLLLALILFVGMFQIQLIMPDASLIYAVFTIVLLGLMAIYVASLQMRRLFNWLLFLVGLRFLILYFQALGGLATTGLGLIISGLMIIGMSYYWFKYRKDIANWAERWMQ